MVITKKLIEGRLRQVIDPELGMNIVDLGLVYEIKLTKNKKQKTKNDHQPITNNQQLIAITMTLTSPGCPLAAVFQPMIRQALADIPGFDPYKDLRLELIFDPPWHQDMMSERAKAELGFS
ncbi:metal-sulfur cluster assembly factor [Candidatus Collierbacteria bacterium]|nr:metal-sulfur cluster assembly factor [Candidatus Collierbacteria bacterium]